MRLFLLVFALLGFAGCSVAERPLQFNLGIEALQLDWNRALDSTSAVILDNVMEGLTSYAGFFEGGSAELLRPMPALAASWSVSESGRVYRFHLKPGVQWTDGVPLDAQQFVDSWERLLSPRTGSNNAYHLLEVENAADYAAGRIKDFSRVGVKALDSSTLEVRLRRPVPYFLHLVASPSTYPIRKDLLERLGEKWTDPELLVTLGAYRVEEWVQGERIVLRSNPSYHGARPRISTVICRIVAEPLTAYTLYENGQLDILPRDLPPSYIQALQALPDYLSGPKLAVNFLMFNLNRPPFDKAANRRAFLEALDRTSLASFFRGTQAPTSTWIPPGLLGHQEGLGLQAIGKQSENLRGLSAVVRFNGSDSWNMVFQVMQRTLAEKTGLKLKLEPYEPREFGKYLAELADGRRDSTRQLPHILSLGWVADYPDPHSFMSLFTSQSENNHTGWKNAHYDRLVEKAVATADESVRRRYYLEAQKILLEEEVVIVPLFLSNHQALVRPGLRGVELNVLDKWFFRDFWFEHEGWLGAAGKAWRRLSAPGR